MRRALTLLLVVVALLFPASGSISTLKAEAAVQPYMADFGDDRQTGGDFFYVYMGSGVFWRCSYSSGVCGPF